MVLPIKSLKIQLYDHNLNILDIYNVYIVFLDHYTMDNRSQVELLNIRNIIKNK